MTTDLPAWDGPRGGSGCDNEDCPAPDQYCRVLHCDEIEQVYPRPERLPMWPLPDPYDFMCTVCGQGYVAGAELPTLGSGASTSGRPDVALDAWDWDDEAAYDGTVRDAVERLARGAPDGTTAAQIVEAVDRHVPGADPDLARSVVAELDVPTAADPVDEYV